MLLSCGGCQIGKRKELQTLDERIDDVLDTRTTGSRIDVPPQDWTKLRARTTRYGE